MAARISLAMIVRDEAPVIARAIRSARPWVDEVVVADTGSTDATAQLAEAEGARVVHVPWEGFARARNQVLDACTGDWVLVLDADEELDPQSGPEVRALAEAGGLVGYHVAQRNHLPGQPPGDVPVVRLFPRHPGIRFAGVLHERIQADVPGYQVAGSGIVVHHHGAAASLDPGSPKARRYEAILREAVESDPADAELRMHLGVALNRRGAFAEAVGQVLEAERLDPQLAALPTAFEVAVGCLYNLGAVPEAAVHARRGLERFPDFPPLLYLAALCAWRLEDRPEALRLLAATEAAIAAYRGYLPLDPRIAADLVPGLRRACTA